MKTLTNFLSINPGYLKCGNAAIAKATGLKEKTVAKFKRTQIFKVMNSQYRNGLV